MLHNAAMTGNGITLSKQKRQDRKDKDRKARLVLPIGNFSAKPGWFPEPFHDFNCQKPLPIQLATYAGIWRMLALKPIHCSSKVMGKHILSSCHYEQQGLQWALPSLKALWQSVSLGSSAAVPATAPPLQGCKWIVSAHANPTELRLLIKSDILTFYWQENINTYWF